MAVTHWIGVPILSLCYQLHQTSDCFDVTVLWYIACPWRSGKFRSETRRSFERILISWSSGHLSMIRSLENHVLSSHLCILTISFCPFYFLKYNRPRVPHHSEKGTTSRTRLVVGAERFPTTSKRRHALHADTPPRKWETLTGDKRQRAGELLVLDVWDTWRLWPAGSRMDSGREHKPRKWLLARSKLLYSC